MAQETVKEVINRIVKSINTIKTDVSFSATDIRKVSPEPPICQGCMDGISINSNCDICRYRVLLKARHMTAYDIAFPLRVSTLIK
jgi:DNA-directed RNA polymerase subunit RPC12/RpoP